MLQLNARSHNLYLNPPPFSPSVRPLSEKTRFCLHPLLKTQAFLDWPFILPSELKVKKSSDNKALHQHIISCNSGMRVPLQPQSTCSYSSECEHRFWTVFFLQRVTKETTVPSSMHFIKESILQLKVTLGLCWVHKCWDLHSHYPLDGLINTCFFIPAPFSCRVK